MSEIKYNRDAHAVIGPSDIYLLSNHPSEKSYQDETGFYNIAIKQALDDDISTIAGYQNFTEKNWKKPHGEYESSVRFGDKLDEEVGELHEAFYSEAESREKDILSEMGDVAFCAIALASNSASDLNNCLMKRLYRYTVGVADISHGEPKSPSWHERSALLSTKFAPITISDIDGLIDQNFEPLASTAMNIDPDDGREYSDSDHLNLIRMKALSAVSLADQQYRYGEEDVSSHLKHFDTYSDDIGELAADIILEIAYLAKNALGRNLHSVLRKNVEKIGGRVTANRIDKTDGSRDQNLL
jgi:hypothetical protein